jgi:hypothetical protein
MFWAEAGAVSLKMLHFILLGFMVQALISIHVF